MAIELMINRMEGNVLGFSTLTAFCVFILTASSAQSVSGQGYCNESVPVSLWTDCEGCISSYFPLGGACPSGMLQTTRSHGVRDCHYMLHTSQSSVVKYMGCRHHCTGTTPLPKCCPGYYGPDCQGKRKLTKGNSGYVALSGYRENVGFSGHICHFDTLTHHSRLAYVVRVPH